MRRTLIAVILGLFLAGAARAGELIFLRNGDVFDGEVLRSETESVTVKVEYEGKLQTFRVPVGNLDKYFFYKVRDRALGDDAKGRIELAKYAVMNEMYSRAGAQMRRAESIDPELVADFRKNRFPEIKEGIAERLLKSAKRALAAGSTKMAKKYATLILTKLEGTKVDAEAQKILDEVHKKIDEKEAARRAQRRKSEARDTEIAANKKATRTDSILDPIEKMMDEAKTLNRNAIRADNLSEGRNGFEAATTKYKRALREIKTRRKGAGEATTKTLDELEAQAKAGGVEAQINLANLYAGRQSYANAFKALEVALEIDPHSAAAKAARAGISTSGGWARRGGGRR